MYYTSIIGWGFQVPEEKRDNSYFSRLSKDSGFHVKCKSKDDKGKKINPLTEADIEKKAGMLERYACKPDEYVHDLGISAAKKALEIANIIPDDLEGILFGTVTSQHGFPSSAILVQRGINAKNASVCNDVAAACAGFITSLNYADAMIKRKIYQGGKPGYWLVLGGETLTKIVSFDDANCHLFGDGVGALVLAPPQEFTKPYRKGLYGVIKAFEEYRDSFDKIIEIDGKEITINKSELIYRDKDGFLRMPNGGQVMKNAVDCMSSAIINIREKLNWSAEDVDLVIPHQANLRIIRLTGLKAKNKNTYINVQKYGNMSAATVPAAFTEAIEDKTIKENSKVILVAYGSGDTWNACACEFTKDRE